MLILHGDSPIVSVVRFGDRDVWTSGLSTPHHILQTYMNVVIVHVENELPAWDIRGMYVINSGSVLMNETIVNRGAYCVNGSFEHGLYRLRHLV